MTQCAKHGKETVKFDRTSQMAVCEVCDMEMIAAAYERGAAWATENPNSSEYVKKAARDYADKTTSQKNT